MNKTLFINTAWDAAECSWRQCDAINKTRTDWSARHIRITPTFYDANDIVPENYNRDEFVSLIEEANVLHFCSSYIPENKEIDNKYHFNKKFYTNFKWGFDWYPLIKNKVKIFHDYCSWDGYWADHVKSQEFINIKNDIQYNAVFSSVPQASLFMGDCVYIPDVVDINKYIPTDINNSNVVVCHFPTGGGNRKNTHEFEAAILGLTDIKVILNKSGTNNHSDIISAKQKSTLGFDCIWRGFHGATGVENLAMGIPTMCGIDDDFIRLFGDFFSTDYIPFINTQRPEHIRNTILFYNTNKAEFLNDRKKVRDFMKTKWNYTTIANAIVKEYNKL